MTAILVTGYKSFELGIFNEKDARVSIIKKAIEKEFIHQINNGADWFIFTGNLGFEVWALEIANHLKIDYDIRIATLFMFENQGSNWNEANQDKLGQFKDVDFVKYSFKDYQNPSQFSAYNQFVIDNTEGAFVFYDEEHETNLKYLVTKMKEKNNYSLSLLTFDRLNEFAMDQDW